MWATSQHSVNYLDDLHYNQTVSDKSGPGLVKTGTGMTGARDTTRHHQQDSEDSEEVETTPCQMTRESEPLQQGPVHAGSGTKSWRKKN